MVDLNDPDLYSIERSGTCWGCLLLRREADQEFQAWLSNEAPHYTDGNGWRERQSTLWEITRRLEDAEPKRPVAFVDDEYTGCGWCADCLRRAIEIMTDMEQVSEDPL